MEQDINEPVPRFPELEPRFKVESVIGQGTFSTVYKAVDTANGNSTVALKRSRTEINCLMELGGLHHVVQLLDVVRSDDAVTLVLPYFRHQHFKDYYLRMELDDVRRYMTALFKALAHTHQHGIVHRDVKPSNFLHDFERRSGFCLVDFGLSRRAVKGRDEEDLPSELPPPPAFPPTSSTPLTRARVGPRSTPHKRQRDGSSGELDTGTDHTDGMGRKRARRSAASLDSASVPSSPNTPPTLLDCVNALDGALKSVTVLGDFSFSTPWSTSSNRGLGSAASVLPMPLPGPGANSGPALPSGLPDGAGPDFASRQSNTAAGPVPPRPLQQAQMDREGESEGDGEEEEADAISGRSRRKRRAASRSLSGRTGPPHVVRPRSADLHRSRKAFTASSSLVARARQKPSIRDLPGAPRSGTRGFRAPEILMRSTQQTSAVDLWSAGVILLCILTRRYPWFLAHDDMLALCEEAHMFGADLIDVPSRTLRFLHPPALLNAVDPTLEPELKLMNEKEDWMMPVRYWSQQCVCTWPTEFAEAAFDLLRRCLDLNPESRITAKQALVHPFLAQTKA